MKENGKRMWATFCTISSSRNSNRARKNHEKRVRETNSTLNRLKYRFGKNSNEKTTLEIGMLHRFVKFSSLEVDKSDKVTKCVARVFSVGVLISFILHSFCYRLRAAWCCWLYDARMQLICEFHHTIELHVCYSCGLHSSRASQWRWMKTAVQSARATWTRRHIHQPWTTPSGPPNWYYLLRFHFSHSPRAIN